MSDQRWMIEICDECSGVIEATYEYKHDHGNGQHFTRLWVVPESAGPGKWRGGAVDIAYCPEHGLHGARTTCFECGEPVRQIRMAPVNGDQEAPQVSSGQTGEYGECLNCGGHGRAGENCDRCSPSQVSSGEGEEPTAFSHYLCGACGEITRRDCWTGLVRDEDTDEFRSARDGEEWFYDICPACGYRHWDDDGDPGVWDGSRAEMEQERAVQFADLADFWIDRWKELASAPRPSTPTDDQGGDANGNSERSDRKWPDSAHVTEGASADAGAPSTLTDEERERLERIADCVHGAAIASTRFRLDDADFLRTLAGKEQR